MLTDTACRKAKPGANDRKLPDGDNLYLMVRSGGSKSWWFRYYWAGKEKKLGLGRYPAISLAQARRLRTDADELKERGIDPAEARKAEKLAASSPDNFRSAALEWHAAKSPEWAPRTAKAVLARLEANAFPKLGPRKLDAITPPMVLEAIRAVEARGSRDMARRVRQHISEVFVWGIGSGLCEQDPANIIQSALQPHRPKMRPARLTLPEARAALATIEACSHAWWATLLASRLIALTAARPGMVREAARSEFEGLDGPEPVWRIPAQRMKLTADRKADPRYAFAIPLSRQAVDVVVAAMQLSESPTHLFPAQTGWRKLISDNTVSKLYRETSLRGQMVPHGWRATFNTIMSDRATEQERDGDLEIIDKMLAHMKGDVQAVYNRASYFKRRRIIAQDWADLLLADQPQLPAIREGLRRALARRQQPEGPQHEARPSTGPKGKLA